jgi:hypothetical protein
VAKSAGRKRRYEENRLAQARAERIRTPVQAQARKPRRKTWSESWATFLSFVGVVAFICLVPVFWEYIAPAISALVGPVPVLAVIAGWLPVGGALAAVGFYLVNQDDLLPKTREKLTWVLKTWGVLGLATMPIDIDSPPLSDSYYAGLRMGFLGTLTGAALVPIGVYLLWKPFNWRKEPTTAAWGYTFIIFAVVLLLLAAASAWLV